jgi:Methyltransferase domain
MDNKSETQSAVEGPMLLSSMAYFWSLLEPLLMATQARNLCEIGIGKGEFTAKLIEYCRQNSGHYTGIDPRAARSLVPQDAPAVAEMISSSSFEALRELAPQDVYFLDGDHNYHTVRNELRLILERPGRWPLVILHDVCWPWGRRDQYCEPLAIPETARHAHSTKLGVIPGRNELGAGGFSGEASDYVYAAASHEDGPRNGVLTAVEDFLREPTGREWRLLVVPVIFGLGILYAPEKATPETMGEIVRLEKAITPLQALMEMMERNRVDLFMAYLRHMEELKAPHAEYQKLHSAYEELAAHSRDLLGKYDELFQKYGELRAYTDSLQAAHDKLKPRSKALKAGQ